MDHLDEIYSILYMIYKRAEKSYGSSFKSHFLVFWATYWLKVKLGKFQLGIKTHSDFYSSRRVLRGFPARCATAINEELKIRKHSFLGVLIMVVESIEEILKLSNWICAVKIGEKKLIFGPENCPKLSVLTSIANCKFTHFALKICIFVQDVQRNMLVQ